MAEDVKTNWGYYKNLQTHKRVPQISHFLLGRKKVIFKTNMEEKYLELIKDPKIRNQKDKKS